MLPYKQHLTDKSITTNSSPFEIPLLLLIIENGHLKQNELYSTYRKLTSNINVNIMTHKLKGKWLKTIGHTNNQRKAGTRTFASGYISGPWYSILTLTDK